jgi:hypothetical protein
VCTASEGPSEARTNERKGVLAFLRSERGVGSERGTSRACSGPSPPTPSDERAKASEGVACSFGTRGLVGRARERKGVASELRRVTRVRAQKAKPKTNSRRSERGTSRA